MSGRNQSLLRGSVRGIDEALCTEHRLRPGGQCSQRARASVPLQAPHDFCTQKAASGRLDGEAAPPREVAIHLREPPAASCWMAVSPPQSVRRMLRETFLTSSWCSAFQLLTAVIIPPPGRQLPSVMPRGTTPSNEQSAPCHIPSLGLPLASHSGLG